jgi:hypothetical protein
MHSGRSKVAGQPINWYPRRQDVVALSVTGAEYIAACEGAKDAACIRQILPELGQQNITPTMRLDNEAAAKMTQPSAYHRRTRHIEHRYHYVREEVQKGYLKIIGVPGQENLADPLTKVVHGPVLAEWKRTIGVIYSLPMN